MIRHGQPSSAFCAVLFYSENKKENKYQIDMEIIATVKGMPSVTEFFFLAIICFG